MLMPERHACFARVSMSRRSFQAKSERPFKNGFSALCMPSIQISSPVGRLKYDLHLISEDETSNQIADFICFQQMTFLSGHVARTNVCVCLRLTFPKIMTAALPLTLAGC